MWSCWRNDGSSNGTRSLPERNLAVVPRERLLEGDADVACSVIHCCDSNHAMNASRYRRTPLPKRAQVPVGWVAVCFMALVLSPFVGFAVHGKVGDEGLMTTLVFAALPLAGFVVITAVHWYSWRTLPPHLVEERKSGRVVRAEGAPSVVAPILFSAKDDWIQMRPEGIAFSRNTLLSMQGVPDFLAKAWSADQAGESFVAWTDIDEWIVEYDSDGPNYHGLKVRPRGMIRLRRFEPGLSDECALLDAVRFVGKLSVRLRCDVECNPETVSLAGS